MKALYFQPDVRRVIAAKLLSLVSKDAYWGKASPLVFGEVPEPKLPSPDWAKIKCRLSGICGSDLAAVTLKGSLDNPITKFISFPMFLGHEIVGEIAEVGQGIRDFRAGQRVVLYPILSCAPRAISPLCPSCQKGDYHLCQNYAEGCLPPGQCIGVNSRTGGGFSEYVVAHHSQLFRVPDDMPDDHAVLFDPLCVGLHAVLMAGLEDSQTVLVIGSGIIGLSVIQMIRALNKRCKVYAVARYDFQKELAFQCGADKVLADSDDPKLSADLAEELKAKQYHSRFVKPFFMGGFDAVLDCIGSAATLHQSIRWTRHDGKVILVGANPSQRFEWSLLYWKEIHLSGSISYAVETIDGGRVHAFDIVSRMIAQQRLKLDLLPVHRFPLGQYQHAFRSLVEKGKHRPVKVAFAFP